MRDEDLELFIEELGEPTSFRGVSSEEAEAYRGILPDKLLEYWLEVGWSGFSDGLFWLTNPANFEHLAEMWLEDTGFPDIDRYHVIGRSAFGKLYMMGEQTHQTFVINCPMHAIIARENKLKKVAKDADVVVQSFFAMSDKEKFDIEDINDKPMFDQALKKLGSLGADEVYGFEPSLIAGGNLLVNNLAKLNLDIHLTILRQMAAPKIPFANIKQGRLG